MIILNTTISIKIFGITIFNYTKKVSQCDNPKNIEEKNPEEKMDIKETNKIQFYSNGPMYTGRIRPDLNKNHQKKKIPSIKIQCPTCGALTYDDDLKICSSCGKTICSNCGSIDSNSNLSYCEDCWKEL